MGEGVGLCEPRAVEPPIPALPLEAAARNRSSSAAAATGNESSHDGSRGGKLAALSAPRSRQRAHRKKLPDAVYRRHTRGRMRYYSRPQHMPVLMSRDLIFELERRFPLEFQRTRQHRLRLGDELELNFFYNHYLRAEQFPISTVPSSRIEFTYAQRCAGSKGEMWCARHINNAKVDFATFNDDATSREKLDDGLAALRKVLTARFGSFA